MYNSQVSAKNDLSDISDWFKGNFSTSEQVAKDSTIADLHLKVSQFSLEEKPGVWAYLERSNSADLDHPYRQEVYHFTLSSLGLITLDIYKIKNQLKYVGACENESLLKLLTFDKLEPKSNCSIVLNKSDKIYIGTSAGKNCPSTLRNATYATTDMEITKVDFFIWERGYNSQGVQVWGSQTSGYIFKKLK